MGYHPTHLMLSIPDRLGLAERFRHILVNQNLSVEAAAERLKCDAVSVQALLDGSPELHVIVAIVREFAVDPNWLLTGEYKFGTHQAAVEDPVRTVHDLMKRIESPRSSSSSDLNSPS